MNDVADLMMRFRTDGEEGAIRALNAVDRGIDNVDRSAKSAKSGLGGMFATAGGFVIGGAINMVAGSIFEIGKGILFANANAEQSKLALETVMGSADAANAKFKELQEFAKETPFSFPELVQSAINLESFGIKSSDWINTIGDTAAGMGKSVDQVTQAVLDAQGGQFERLNELGIRARVEGEKIKFFYSKNGQDMTAEADKNSQSMINSTISGIWNDKYEGAMEKQSTSFIGRWSTLKDNINMKLQEVSGGIFGFASGAIGILNSVFANGFFDTFDNFVSPSILDFIYNLKELGSAIIDAFGSGKGVKELIEGLPESWQGAATAILKVSDSLGDLWDSISEGDYAQFFEDLGGELKTIASAGIDLGVIVLRGTASLLTNVGSDFYAWVKGQLFGGNMANPYSNAPGAQGSSGLEDISIGDVIVAGIVKLGGDLSDLSASIERELGLQVTSGDLEESYAAGQAAGRDLGGSIVDGIQNGIEIATSAESGGSDGGGIWNGIKKVLKWEPEMFRDDEATAIDDAFTWAQGYGSGLRDSIVEGLTSGMSGGSDNLYASLQSAGDEAILGFLTGVANGWLAVDEWFNSRSEAVVNAVGDLTDTILQKGADLIDGMWDGALAQWDAFTGWLSGLGGSIEGWVGDLSGVLWNTGWNAAWGLAEGIKAGAYALVAPAVGIINSIIDGITDFVKPGSPSRRFLPVGQSIPWALSAGMDSMLPSLQKSVGRANDALGFSASAAFTSRISASGVSTPGSSGENRGGDYYDLRGSIIGADVMKAIDERIAAGSAKRVNRGVSRGRLESSYA